MSTQPDRAATSTFRDTLIVGGLAVVGMIGLVVWGGGSAGSSADSPTPDPATDTPIETTGTVSGTGSGAEPAVAVAVTTGTGGEPGPADPASYEAQVEAQDALIAGLPTPAGGTEAPPDGGGLRSWRIAGTDWEAQRDAYLGVLTSQGYTASVTETIDENDAVGELHQLTHTASGVTLELAVASFEGQTIIEVSRQ